MRLFSMETKSGILYSNIKGITFGGLDTTEVRMSAVGHHGYTPRWNGLVLENEALRISTLAAARERDGQEAPNLCCPME